MKKVFLSPFFTPLFFLITWGIILAVVLIFFPEQKYEITKDGEIIDIATYCGYALLLGGFLYFIRDYKTWSAKTDWIVFFLLSICALLREAGIQHHLSSTDTTPFKSRFFLNPNNPLSEKILYGFILLVVFGMLVYIAVKYTKHLVTSFFKMNTVTWTTAVLCCDLVFAKFADRFPGNWRKMHNDVALPHEQIEVWSLLEESSEIFLPIVAFIILWQYHLLHKEQH